MLLGLSIEAFTLLHVVISLVGIATGLFWLLAAIGGRWLSWMNAVFLVTTVATTVTGFMFPITAFTPALGVGGRHRSAARAKPLIDPTPLRLLFGQGHQHFLDRLARVPAQPAPPPRGR